MTREVKLSDIDQVLSEVDYPATRADVADELEDVTLLYADGEEPLPEVLDRVNAERFEEAEELRSELYSALPVEAVGEPGQSEGEG